MNSYDKTSKIPNKQRCIVRPRDCSKHNGHFTYYYKYVHGQVCEQMNILLKF